MAIFKKQNMPTDEPLKRGRGRPRKQPVEPVQTEITPQPKPLRVRNWPVKKILSVAVVILLILGISLFFYNKGKQSSDQTASDKKLVAKIAKHALLPTNETPVVYKITDPEKLKGQSFFAGAQKDDVVLAYSKSNRAVIYRPSVDRVVEAVLIPVGSNPQTGQ